MMLTVSSECRACMGAYRVLRVYQHWRQQRRQVKVEHIRAESAVSPLKVVTYARAR